MIRSCSKLITKTLMQHSVSSARTMSTSHLRLGISYLVGRLETSAIATSTSSNGIKLMMMLSRWWKRLQSRALSLPKIFQLVFVVAHLPSPYGYQFKYQPLFQQHLLLITPSSMILQSPVARQSQQSRCMIVPSTTYHMPIYLEI